MKRKVLISTGCAAFLLLGSLRPAFAAMPEFPDMDPQNPAQTAMALLADRGIVTGYGDGTFRPGALR